MRKVLTKKFFDRPVLEVSRELLGKFLVRKIGEHTLAVMITETEAYDGPHDLACHASKGRTPRTEIMFGEAGRFYVYFTYGMHWMLNIVTGAEGYPAAVLIRAGVSAPELRSTNNELREIRGPARLTKYLSIDKTLNGKPASHKSRLWVEDRGVVFSSREVRRGPRIGVDYAGAWKNRPYNFKVI